MFDQNDRGQGGQDGGFRKPMVKGNWQCSECNAEISELPFEPDGQRPVFCRDCHRKRRDDFRR